MPNRDVNVESSMDEILAKVQREFTEEGKQAVQAVAERDGSAEVVELNPPGDARKREAADESVGSTISGSGAATALAELAAIYRERRRASEFPMGAAGTLENVVRGMLSPMLQAWLDAKLPDMLERLVRAELSRAIGGAV